MLGVSGRNKLYKSVEKGLSGFTQESCPEVHHRIPYRSILHSVDKQFCEVQLITMIARKRSCLGLESKAPFKGALFYSQVGARQGQRQSTSFRVDGQ